MMNSVGTEKDPYLQAYIQARMKNHVEEVKLQKVLANLEVGRRIKKIMLNMELFEDRKMAHKLKREATDLDSDKKKDIGKFLNNRMACFDKLPHNPGVFTFTNLPRSRKISTNTTADGAMIDKRMSIFPVTKGNTAHDQMMQHQLDVKSAPQARHSRSPRHSIVPDPHLGHHHVTITVPNSPNRLGIEARRRLTRENSISGLRSDTSFTPGTTTTNMSTPSAGNAAARRRSSNVLNMSTPVIRVDDFSCSPDRLKTAATVPARGSNSKRAMDVRSVQTLPTLLPSQNSSSSSPTRANRPKTSSLWPGDPNAIRSVRRHRKKPEEMLSLVKNGEEARRMIRDMPPTCSKNCSKPDILQELGRSYTDLPNLLPAIEKARQKLAAQEAANRDTVEDDLEEEQAMPVSEIKYMALRSMGGVRRNSVIA